MSQPIKSLIFTQDLSDSDLTTLFLRARKFLSDFESLRSFSAANNASKVVSFVFLEPSTRTRLSFEMACKRLGMQTALFESSAATSLSKGEGYFDTLATIRAMDPDLLLVRAPEYPNIVSDLLSLGRPVINCGIGHMSHPTQALLDSFTIIQSKKEMTGQRILFVGDVQYSRVANCDKALFERLGATVATCSPEEFLPTESNSWDSVENFKNLEEGLKWCTVCMPLRVQAERHSQSIAGRTSEQGWSERFIKKYRIDEVRLKLMDKDGLLMNPGPYVPGYELDPGVFKDPRCQIRNQVRFGVYVRAALLSMMCDIEIG